MNEQAKQVVTAAEIQIAFSHAEKAIQEAMQRVLLLGRKTDRYSEENGITPFQSAPLRKDFGDAAKGLGDALSAVTDMHRKAASLDPEPSTRSGEGK